MTAPTANRTIAVIPARGGSKGIPHKNLIDHYLYDSGGSDDPADLPGWEE